MSRKDKRKQQKTKTSTGKWLKKLKDEQKDIPKKYADIINKDFWDLV